MAVIDIQQLVKAYGERRALDGLCLRVESKRLFGFLGPNGAGKTTAIRILLGLLRGTSGQAGVLGRDAWRDGARIRREVGYLPGDTRLYENMSAAATLRFLDGVRGGQSGPEIRRLAERFALDLRQKVRKYSRGMKQKLGLIQALMHRPALLVLDEPTITLDPLMRQALYDELRQARNEGRTVLFSSHTLSEVEELCDEVAIVRAGRVVEQQSIDALRARALRRVRLRWGAAPPHGQTMPKGLRVTSQADGRLEGAWSGPIDQLLRWLASQPVADVVIAPPDLADLFLSYYSDKPARGSDA